MQRLQRDCPAHALHASGCTQGGSSRARSISRVGCYCGALVGQNETPYKTIDHDSAAALETVGTTDVQERLRA
eukprot:8949977-Alexandrium_andersonii.AAC.1